MSMNTQWMNRRVPVVIRVGGVVVSRKRVLVRVPSGMPERRVKMMALEKALGDVVVSG